jgi:hypothetical protein
MQFKSITALVVLLLVVASLLVAGCTSSSSPTATPTAQATATPQPTYVPKSTPGYLNYTNRSAGVAIQYPSSWNVTEGGVNITVLFTLPGTAVGFSVGTEDLSGVKLPLDEYARLGLQNLKQNSSFTSVTLLNSTNTTLAGYPAHEFVFTAVETGVTMQFKAEITIIDNTGYTLMYGATKGVYPDYVATADNMVASFHLVK